MNGPMDDIMADLARDAAAQSRRRRHKVRFQEGAVEQVLKHFRLGWEGARLRELCRAQSGEGHLLFSWFHDQHRDFPVWLGARNLLIKSLRQFRELAWKPPVKSTGRSPVIRCRAFQAFADVRDSAPEGWDRPVGMIVRWHHLGRQWKIIHTADLPVVTYQERVLIHTKEGTETLIHQDLETFLQALSWTP